MVGVDVQDFQRRHVANLQRDLAGKAVVVEVEVWSTTRPEKSPNSGGMEPLNPLLPRSSNSRELSREILGGMVSLRL
ncbi:hypothetical protein GUJ93_ZPchr0012g18797 [Zizania palustris]|uniref:Uncharacterized protein n=1 Tax=Zizania palustris TaxID=103762 RepID=A0A8J5WNN6_ZIZPA|nr:hypothetical protein GUJ93_ZPchr0012g18797 [Zizania palustris]